MNSGRNTTRQEVLTRVFVSVLLVLVALVLWMVGCRLTQGTLRQWTYSVASGLVVLGLAGIWVSYFAERQAGTNITRKVEDRFSILTSCFDAGICSFYRSRHDPAFWDKLLTEMRKSSEEIRILSVAAREFLHEGHEGEWDAYDNMHSLSKDKCVRFLLLHPWSEQALSRALHEDLQHSTFDRYRDTRLYHDVTRSCDTLVGWASLGLRVEARLYKVMPSCYLVITSNVMFLEPYHFGTGGRASGKVPVLEARKGGRLYEQYWGHFDHVWMGAEPFSLSGGLATSLRNPSSVELTSFRNSIRFLRPDLA